MTTSYNFQICLKASHPRGWIMSSTRLPIIICKHCPPSHFVSQLFSFLHFFSHKVFALGVQAITKVLTFIMLVATTHTLIPSLQFRGVHQQIFKPYKYGQIFKFMVKFKVLLYHGSRPLLTHFLFFFDL